MKNITRILLPVCFGLIVAAGVLLAEVPEAPKAPEVPGAPKVPAVPEKSPLPEATPEVPEGQVLVDEYIFVVFVDEPEHHLGRARESFLKRDMKAAAAEIHTATGFLKLQAARASGGTKKALHASIKELDELARDVEKGTVATADKLEQPFARALHALAEHHHQKASQSWAKRATKKTGHDLKATAHHLEHGFKWSGEKVEQGTHAVIKDTRLVAGKLVEGTGWATHEVGNGITAVGKEVQKLGKKIEPRRMTPGT